MKQNKQSINNNNNKIESGVSYIITTTSHEKKHCWTSEKNIPQKQRDTTGTRVNPSLPLPLSLPSTHTFSLYTHIYEYDVYVTRERKRVKAIVMSFLTGSTLAR